MYSDLSETSHELAPDLEWMLQSNQVSNELLLETLVHEHGVELYQLARSLLGDSRAAREVVAATILAVIEKRKRFWGKGSAKDWLFSLVIQTVFRRWLSFRTLRALRAVAPGRYRGVEEEAPLPESHWEAELWLCVDQLRRDQQAILSLKALNDLSETEIAQILNIPEPRVRLRLKQIWGKLEPILANLEINGEDFGSRVASSLRRRWRLEKFSDVDQCSACDPEFIFGSISPVFGAGDELGDQFARRAKNTKSISCAYGYRHTRRAGACVRDVHTSTNSRCKARISLAGG